MSQANAAKAPYLPRPRTAGYAVLVALSFDEKENGTTAWTKVQISDLAYPKWTDTEIIKQAQTSKKDKGKTDFYDGWTSVANSLIKKHNLIMKIHRKPSQGIKTDHYKLTEDGRQRAEMLIKKYSLDPSGPQVGSTFGFGTSLNRLIVPAVAVAAIAAMMVEVKMRQLAKREVLTRKRARSLPFHISACVHPWQKVGTS